MLKSLLQSGGILSILAFILVVIPIITYILSGLVFGAVGYIIYLIVDEHNETLKNKHD